MAIIYFIFKAYIIVTFIIAVVTLIYAIPMIPKEFEKTEAWNNLKTKSDCVKFSVFAYTSFVTFVMSFCMALLWPISVYCVIKDTFK